jgi:recombination protein RecA
VRLDIRRIGQIKEAAASDKKDPVAIGNRTRVKVVKNKMAPPFREVEFDILYGHGISKSGDIIDLATDLGIVDKSGAWFSFNGERIGQGRENAKTYLEQHPQLMDKLEAMILTKHNIKGRGIAEGEAKDGDKKEAAAKPADKAGDKKDAKEVAPDGKPVVRMTPPAKNGVEEKRPAGKPAN